MGRTALAVATLVVACVLALTAVQPRETVTVSPSFGIAGHYGTWTVTYTVGPGGYLRLRQRSQVRGRDVMAWSSPVWVNAR